MQKTYDLAQGAGGDASPSRYPPARNLIYPPDCSAYCPELALILLSEFRSIEKIETGGKERVTPPRTCPPRVRLLFRSPPAYPFLDRFLPQALRPLPGPRRRAFDCPHFSPNRPSPATLP